MSVKEVSAPRPAPGTSDNDVRVEPGKKRNRVLGKILADALLAPRSYIGRWVVNRGAE